MSVGYPTYARDIMTSSVETVAPETSVDAAARTMFERSISGLPVVSTDGLLIGVVSEYDIISRNDPTVGDIMTRDVVSIGEDTEPETIARLLINQRIRRLPVVREGRVVGIISRSDLVKLFALTRWSCESC